MEKTYNHSDMWTIEKEDKRRHILYDMLGKELPGWGEKYHELLGIGGRPLTKKERENVEQMLEWMRKNPDSNMLRILTSHIFLKLYVMGKSAMALRVSTMRHTSITAPELFYKVWSYTNNRCLARN